MFKLLQVGAMMVLWLSSTAQGQTTGDECAKIADGAERLVCYDAVFRIKKSDPLPVAGSAWILSRNISRIDDKEELSAQVQASDGYAADFNRSHRPILAIGCHAAKTYLWIDFDGDYMSDHGVWGEVTFRIDNRRAFKKRATVSTDNRQLIFTSKDGIYVSKELLTGSVLLVVVTPVSDSPKTIEFPITGAGESLKEISSKCKWPS